MQIDLIQVKNLSYVVVDDLYSSEEVTEIKAELHVLKQHAKSSAETGVALDEDKMPKKNAHGLCLDNHYAIRESSDILRLNRKIFCDELATKAPELNQQFYTLRYCNQDYTLVNFYGANEEYKKHRDNSCLTAVTFFSLGSIEGGDLEFPEANVVVPFKENRMVIFSGCVEHAAKQTIAKPDNYRVSIAQFLNYRD
jgi:hypothetical protein